MVPKQAPDTCCLYFQYCSTLACTVLHTVPALLHVRACTTAVLLYYCTTYILLCTLILSYKYTTTTTTPLPLFPFRLFACLTNVVGIVKTPHFCRTHNCQHSSIANQGRVPDALRYVRGLHGSSRIGCRVVEKRKGMLVKNRFVHK